MKFSVGEIVKIRGNKSSQGKIIQCEKREIVDGTGSYSIERYFIKEDGAAFPEWFHESLLESIKMDSEAEKKVDEMLIDAHLKFRQFDVVKGIVQQNADGK